ncbi:hypothetical protein CC85DRAFT_84994 [Cutaneotrichosporon oleaginosum]|uniref:Xylanolytic transcriptional activator regulatory domain-containing protein n=1 Tax=Cutaneotrichosporon oleaginosum TaxID=879819 RepID=A0A0J0XMW7_9TREE|nr:uncharacterized protein CC85DRAFT_84994 [Cutaneotrichosporon oleaginosum]KLT42427.1 hypothetical protein CC85DRAFT_84994 [Cutaneotrichosporon oleaginosum]TXT06946.1 hypothetical protein COLE_06277 [Cutaneotrichosporon oleaginosum]
MDTQSFERGRFYVSPNGYPRFAGSASGVYLADTVRAQADAGAPAIETAFTSRAADEPDETDIYQHFSLRASDLLATGLRAALENYFEAWHPLFPFLDGAYILSAFESGVLSAMEGSESPVFSRSHAESLALTAVFKSIVAIGDTDGAVTRAGFPRLSSTSQATMLAHLVLGACQGGSISDLLAIQALVALMLFMYLTRRLRPAMHLSGTVTKLAFEAGLHRCPDRYPGTFASATEREMRKRVFWSLYTLDRLLTAEFGVPIMLHDTDVDTCVPGGSERHPLCPPSPEDHPARDDKDSPDDRRKRRRVTASPHGPGRSTSPQIEAANTPSGLSHQPPEPQRQRLLPAFSLVGISRLMGQAMEAFNKSLRYRSIQAQETLQLRTELERWWNDIGFDDDGEATPDADDARSPYKTLFICLYRQQVIALSRPALSLAPTALQHTYALETCVASARVILRTLSREFDGPRRKAADCCGLAGRTESLMWPGYVDMVFFAALILVYAAKREERDSVTIQRLKSDLRRAVRVIEILGKHWNISSFVMAVRAFLDPPKDASATGGEELLDTFLFDFDSFELNWAVHQSLPPSPK